MIELAEAAAQSSADLAQAVGLGDLAEQHGDELIPAGEALDVAIAAAASDGGIEFGAGEKTKKLAKQAARA